MKMSLLNLNMVLPAKEHNIRPIIVDWISIYMMYVGLLFPALLTGLTTVNLSSSVSPRHKCDVIPFPRRTIFKLRHDSAFLGAGVLTPSFIRFAAPVAVPSILYIFTFGVWSVTSDP